MIKNLMKLVFVSSIFIILPVSYSLNITNDSHANVSYPNVDYRIIDELKLYTLTPIVVRLHDDSGLRFTSNVTINRQIYKQIGEYFNEVEDSVLSTLSDKDFRLKFKNKF